MKSNHDIVGLVLNYRDHLRTIHSVKSILNEGARHVLIVDNSEDEGFSSSHLSHLISNTPNITLIISPTNLGFSAGINHGIDYIKNIFGTPRVLLLNNDAYLLNNALQLLANALNEHTQALIAYPDIDHAGHVIGNVYYNKYSGLITKHSFPGSFLYVSGCCLLVALDRLGSTSLFDENFFMYGEDIELAFRIGISRIVHVNKVLAYHELNKSSGTGSEFYETRMILAHLLLARKLAPNRRMAYFLIIAKLPFLISRSCFRAIKLMNIMPIKALLLGWILFIKA